MALTDKLYKTYFKTFVIFTNILWFMRVWVHSWGYALCVMQLLQFWSDGVTGLYRCVIFVLFHCVHCIVETTHFVDAGGRNSQFFPAVGYGCRLLALSGACIGSWVPVFFVLRSLLPYMCEERLFSYVPRLLQVRRCAYDRAVLVLCMPVASYWLPG